MDNYPRRNQSAAPGGPYAPCWMPGSDLVTPGCGTPVKPLCELDMIGERLAGIAPQALFTNFTIAPRRQNYAQLLAKRVLVWNDDDPTSFSQVIVQSITINDCAVVGFSAAPALANTSGVSSIDWTAPDGWGVPIPGFIVSQANLVGVYQEGGFNPEPVTGGQTLTYQASFYVNGLSSCPAGWNEACQRRLC